MKPFKFYKDQVSEQLCRVKISKKVKLQTKSHSVIRQEMRASQFWGWGGVPGTMQRSSAVSIQHDYYIT